VHIEIVGYNEGVVGWMIVTQEEDEVIDEYEVDETMMIIIFAQWCLNHDLDAVALYHKADANQPENKALLAALDETVDKKESEDISTALVQYVLQLFGNDDLAFVIQEEIDKK